MPSGKSKLIFPRRAQYLFYRTITIQILSVEDINVWEGKPNLVCCSAWPAAPKQHTVYAIRVKFFSLVIAEEQSSKVRSGKLVRKQEITYKKKPCITNFPVFPLVFRLNPCRLFLNHVVQFYQKYIVNILRTLYYDSY